MKERVIYDPGEPVPLRRYASEALASLDQGVLDAAGIPAFLQLNRYAEVDSGAVVLVVRRRDLQAARDLLDARDSTAGEPGDLPSGDAGPK